MVFVQEAGVCVPRAGGRAEASGAASPLSRAPATLCRWVRSGLQKPAGLLGGALSAWLDVSDNQRDSGGWETPGRPGGGGIGGVCECGFQAACSRCIPPQQIGDQMNIK